MEDHDVKAGLLGELTGPRLRGDPRQHDLLAVGRAPGPGQRAPDRFVGLHVFNPVTKMRLVELVFPQAASERDAPPAPELCEAFEKMPSKCRTSRFRRQPAAVPLLFSAVRLMEETSMAPADVDTACSSGRGTRWGRWSCST